MKIARTLITAAVFMGAAQAAEAQTPAQKEQDARLRDCAMEIVDDNAGRDAKKAFGEYNMTNGVKSYHFVYTQGDGTTIRESRIMLRSDMGRKDTLSVKVSMGFRSPNVATMKFDDAATTIQMDKTRLDLPYKIYTDRSSSYTTPQQTQEVRAHALKLMNEVLKCMNPKIG